jgi:hypothetical protein
MRIPTLRILFGLLLVMWSVTVWSVSGASAQETLRRSYNDGGDKALKERKYAEAERLFRTAIQEAESAQVQDSTLTNSPTGRYVLLVSDETLRELEDHGYPEEKRSRCLGLVVGLPRLAVIPEVIELAGYYVDEGVMPSNDIGDAVHLACATWYRIPYLLTWNCKHLANANKFEHIQVLHARRRLVSPMIVTPEQLLELEP